MSTKDRPKEGSGKKKKTPETNIAAKGEAKANMEEDNDDETDDDTIESRDHDRDKTHLKTTELELAKNAGTILRAAAKRKGGCSSTYNLESKLDEYESRNEELTSQIAKLNEISSRSQRTTVDLF